MHFCKLMYCMVSVYCNYACRALFFFVKSQQVFWTLKIIISPSLQSIYFKLRNHANSYMTNLVKVLFSQQLNISVCDSKVTRVYWKRKIMPTTTTTLSAEAKQNACLSKSLCPRTTCDKTQNRILHCNRENFKFFFQTSKKSNNKQTN